MQKKRQRDTANAPYSEVSGLLQERLSAYGEMLRLAHEREALLTSDRLAEIAAIAQRKAELAEEIAEIDERVRDALRRFADEGRTPPERIEHETKFKSIVDELVAVERRFQRDGRKRIERLEARRAKMSAGSQMARAYGKSAHKPNARFIDKKQ